jgi:hypothetical protein
LTDSGAQVAQQAQAQELEALSAQLFATTLLDDSPAHNETTRSTIPRTNPASSDDSSIQIIVDGVRRIGLSPESNTTSTEEFRRLSPDTSLSRVQDPSLPSTVPIPASSRLHDQRASKEEQNQHTKIALTQLDNVQSDIQTSANALVSLPSAETIAKVKQLIKTWQRTLASINRNVPLVKTRKAEVTRILRHLEARISEVDMISPSDPIQYDTGRLSVSTSVTGGLTNHRRSFVS